MAKIIKSVHIKSDPHKVIDYISDVQHHPAFISALKWVDNLSGDPKSNKTSWDWSFVMSGVELRGKAETVVYEAGKIYSFKTSGTNSTFIYRVEPEDDGTLLTIEVEYELPESVLSKIADKAVVEHLNEEEANRAAENLKAILEG